MKNKNISKSQKKQQNNFLTALRDFENKIEDKFQDMWLKTFLMSIFPQGTTIQYLLTEYDY